MLCVPICCVCLYLCLHNFSKSAKPIFTKFGARVYDVPQKTPKHFGNDSPIGGATATNSKRKFIITYKLPVQF